jgi:hypothetical protein
MRMKLRIVLNYIAPLLAFTAFVAALPASAQQPPPAQQPPAPPAIELPRETAIENPLGRGEAISGTALGGYGELTLNAPSNAPAVVDLRRLVLFVGHNFTDRIRFYSELEIEHAVSSADDQGEVEVEQAYLDGLLGRRLNLRAGLILMPVGIVNIYHEPPTFNGVERPDVDLFVIPSTWREPGIGIFGELADGLRYQLFLVNGLNANGFSAAAAVAEGHQEGQLAAARDFGAVGRVDWEPRLGTDVGLSGYLATAGNSLRGTVGNVPVGLVEVDARTQRGGFRARAEVAFLFIGQAAALNQALAAGDPEQMAAVAVSSQSRGAYLDVGYDVLRLLAPGTLADLTVFGRYDYVDTQVAVPAGFVADRALMRQTLTAGLVYRPIPQIGLKLDYRRHIPGAGDGWNELASAITWMF